LKTLSIENFRSIRGEINVSLDAPVVLIHGQNGAGKTSLLSALELALTGAIPSLARAERDYLEHLPHKQAKGGRGRIELTGGGLGDRTEAKLTVTKTAIAGAHLLDDPTARFFSERCYLAQSTLTRLLELYEDVDARKSDSRLTRFVKELLRLDQLDAIIDGLHIAGHVTRLREPAPIFWGARKDIPEMEQDIVNDREEERSLAAEQKTILDRLTPALGALLKEGAPAPIDLVKVEAQLRATNDEAALLTLARARRDLTAILEQWRGIASGAGAANREGVEKEDAEARAALEAWKAKTGKELDAVIEELRGWIPNLATADSVGPERAGAAALEAVEAELTRIGELFERDDRDAKLETDTEQAIEKGRARSDVLDAQIAEAAGASEGLAQALSELISHIHGDDCPVCGRDFSEVSAVSLGAHVSARIGELVAAAGRLQALTADKATTSAAIAAAGRTLAAVKARRLAAEQRDELKDKRARFDELRLRLKSLQAPAAEGTRLYRRVAAAARALASLRASDQAATVLRQSVDALADHLQVPRLDGAEAISDGAVRLQQVVEERERGLGAREAARRTALQDVEELKRLANRLSQLRQRIGASDTKLAALKDAKTEADRRIGLAKDLAADVRERRTAIVRRVFNDELNALWRDLFVRLAPEEPFVPAFALPETSSGPVEAVLETHYRAGGKGGNPRAMLSAGNLNTAALTLFLALHLSVKPRLPWLVIDDPVQSMDEVHISQFAALLRTLSKQMGRQVIVAVHERPLFEYLALELSPAYLDDRLITIELSRAADGQTVAVWEPKTYEPDRAIAA
jgi:exonuclease SbcC